MKPRIGVTSSPDTHHQRQGDRANREDCAAVLRAGGLPYILPTLDPAHAAEVVAGLDGLLLRGGGDVSPGWYHQTPHPEVYGVSTERDAWEMALVAAAAEGDVPILGVCRGVQLLNVAAGGSLTQHLPDVTDEVHFLRERDHTTAHPVDIAEGSMLAGIVGPHTLGVNTLHHQAVAELGRGMRAVAWAPDGIIEAVESDEGRRVVAIQWHPEMLIDRPRQLQLFKWLVREAAHRSSLVDDVA